MWKKQVYGLDKPVYIQIIGIVQEYPRAKLEYEALLYESSKPQDGMPRSSKVGDPVASVAIRRERKETKVKAVEYGLSQIPEQYHKGLMNNIIKRSQFPKWAHINTWKHYKRIFVYSIAEYLGDI